MSKARQRQRHKRAQYLGNLARTDSRRFLYEWNKRLVSWMEAIHDKFLAQAGRADQR